MGPSFHLLRAFRRPASLNLTALSLGFSAERIAQALIGGLVGGTWSVDLKAAPSPAGAESLNLIALGSDST